MHNTLSCHLSSFIQSNAKECHISCTVRVSPSVSSEVKNDDQIPFFSGIITSSHRQHISRHTTKSEEKAWAQIQRAIFTLRSRNVTIKMHCIVIETNLTYKSKLPLSCSMQIASHATGITNCTTWKKLQVRWFFYSNTILIDSFIAWSVKASFSIYGYPHFVYFNLHLTTMCQNTHNHKRFCEDTIVSSSNQNWNLFKLKFLGWNLFPWVKALGVFKFVLWFWILWLLVQCVLLNKQ